MKNSSRTITMLIAILFIVGSVLTACGSNKESASSSPASSDTSSSEASNAPVDADKPPVELTMFVDASWYPFQDWTGEIPEAITKATGVKPKIVVATDDKQLALMVASGDLPDIVLSFNWTLMSDGNLSYPYNEIFPKYAPDVKFDPIMELVNTAKDGNYYAIRNDFSPESEWKANPNAHMMVPGLSLRKDILAEIGNPEIKSLADLDNVFAQVKEKYPDMTPLLLNPNWKRPFFDTQFGAAGGGFADQDGSLVYYLRQPGLLKSLLYMNSLYRNGYITSENFAYKNETETEQMMKASKAFSYTWTYSGADRLNSIAKEEGLSFVQLAEPLSPEAAIYSNGTGGLGLYVTRSNKKLEDTVRFLKYLYSDEGWKTAQWGIEGKDWNMNPAGYPEFTFDMNDLETLKKKGVYWWGVPTETGVGMALSGYKAGSETTRQGEQYSKIIKFNPAIGMINPASDSPEQIIRTNIDTMVSTEVTKVYLSPTEDEAVKAFNELMAKAEKIGMSKLEAWANEQYGPLKEKYDSLTK